MTSGYAPDRLNDRHHAAALLLAAGYRQVDVARALGYSENRVSILANSPLFRAQLAELQREVRRDALAMIEQEAAASIATLVDVRDRAQSPLDNVRRLAANDLLDRHPALGRRAKLEEDRTLRIEFSTADVAQMRRALGPAPPPPPAPLEPSPPPSRLATLDEALAAARHAAGPRDAAMDDHTPPTT